MNKPLKGVNLGGWLVLEKWMTPSLFKGTDAQDEYEFMLTKKDAARKIEQHRKTFITEADFAWLQKNGIEAVRIPIGYWIFEGDPPYTSTLQYLDWAFAMAKKYSLKVVVDLHGLQGSQNGWDHSGRAGKLEWFRYTQNRRDSITVMRKLIERYQNHAAFWGMQIINEPKPGPGRIFKLLRFYKDAYKVAQNILPKQTSLIVSDSYVPRIVSFLLPKRERLILDVHLYHMTTPFATSRSLDWFYRKTKRRAAFIQRLSKKHPIIIGEWSGVHKHEVVSKVKDFNEAKATKHYIDLQLKAYDTAIGWFYWSYKTEEPGVWNFRSLVEQGTINLLNSNKLDIKD